MKIIGDLVFETGRRIDLPLEKLFLEPIASNLTQSLNIKTQKRKIQLITTSETNGGRAALCVSAPERVYEIRS